MKRLFELVVVICAAGSSILTAQDVPRTLYVLNSLGRTVSKMNLMSGDIVNDVVTVGNIPNRIHTEGEMIYVVNSVPAGITVIDGQTDQVVRNISLTEGSNPWDMAFVGTNRAYVTNLLANTVTIVDVAEGDSVGAIAVGEGPQGILVVNNTAYVTNTGGFPDFEPSTVSVIDIRTDSVTKTVSVATNPQDLALAPNGTIHVLCSGIFNDDSITGKVYVIDPFGDTDFTPVVIDSVQIGGFPGDIVITADGTAYLTDFGDENNGFVYSYDSNSLAVLNDSSDPILVGKGAGNLLFDPMTADLYVSNFSDDTVQLLDAENGSVRETFPFGEGTQDMAILEAITESDAWADAVVTFSPGAGAGFGDNFFPDNVIGPPDPDPNLDEFNPSSKPQEILSLGHGGEIILEFTDNFIVDGDGPDFTVFENVFLFNGEPFIEAAFVSVSTDGESFIEFPWDTTTFSGFAGVSPTLDNQSPTDPAVSGGDMFDLADVGLSFAKFVKLTDIGDLKQEGSFNGDFDLDAVVAINSQAGQPTSVDDPEPQQPVQITLFPNYPNPFNPTTQIDFAVSVATRVQLAVYNLRGQIVRTLVDQPFNPGRYSATWDGKNQQNREVASGVYLYELKAGEFRTSRRLLLVR